MGPDGAGKSTKVERSRIEAMADINVALIGCGAVANSHLAAWQRISRARVLAVCDTNGEFAERTAKKWKVPRNFTSVLEMSDFKEVTLWDICTPIKTHKEIAVQAMRDGFDVLIEKPMTISSEEAKEIVNCQRATGRKAGVIHNWLFEPPILKALSIIKQGQIGETISAHISVHHTNDEPMTASKVHWSHKLPGGRFSEMLIHPIYLLRCFLGDVEVENIRVSKVGEYPWMKSDELFATFRAGRKLAGTYVSFNASRNSIFIDVFGCEGIIRLDIINATINVLPRLKLERLSKARDSLRQAVQLSTSTLKNALKILSRQWFDGHEMCIRLFAESLINDRDPPVSVQEGYACVKVLEDAYKCIGLSQRPA